METDAHQRSRRFCCVAGFCSRCEQRARPATKHICLLREFMTARAWWNLAPDLDNTFLTAGAKGNSLWEQATAAKAADGTWGLVFVPTPRPITVNLAKFSGRVDAHWFDPTCEGRRQPV